MTATDEEVARLVERAVERWGFSTGEIDPGNPTVLHVTLRPPYSSRTFVATIKVTGAREV